MVKRSKWVIAEKNPSYLLLKSSISELRLWSRMTYYSKLFKLSVGTHLVGHNLI